MNPEGLFPHFEQKAEVPCTVLRPGRPYLEYRDHLVQISQMPSGKLPHRKSQMVSGKSQDTLPEPSVRIAQTPSAKLAAAFPRKKRLMEWAETALQSKSRGR
jgi:hypothetical protein